MRAHCGLAYQAILSVVGQQACVCMPRAGVSSNIGNLKDSRRLSDLAAAFEKQNSFLDRVQAAVAGGLS